jgi:uncharacterized protein (DUF1499 family)
MIFSGRRPNNLGVGEKGRLAPCKTTPNCVSSQARSRRHHVNPLVFEGTPAAAISKLRAILQNMKGVTVIQAEPDYLYAECRSGLMGFVDDLEIVCLPEEKRCHIRSASRLGYSDLGVNRRRIESIRNAFNND